jgi:hypothetical protein
VYHRAEATARNKKEFCFSLLLESASFCWFCKVQSCVLARIQFFHGTKLCCRTASLHGNNNQRCVLLSSGKTTFLSKTRIAPGLCIILEPDYPLPNLTNITAHCGFIPKNKHFELSLLT